MARMFGVVKGTVPICTAGGTPSAGKKMTIIVTKSGISGAAEAKIVDNVGVQVKAAAAVTSGTAITVSGTLGTVTITWEDTLNLGDRWTWYVLSTGEVSEPAGTIGNFVGVQRQINIDSEGNMISKDSSKYGSTPEVVVTAQDLTGAYASFAVIDCTGIDVVGILVDADVNLSTNVDLKVMGIFTAAGTPFEVDAFTVKTLWTATTPDFKKYYQFATGNLLFIDIQAMAGVVGGTPGDLTLTVVKA